MLIGNIIGSYCMDHNYQNSSDSNMKEAVPASHLKITVLSTMLTDFYGIGEWGFAALVEVDGRKILFDTGARPETVLNNSKELGIDLSQVEDVFLSHNHWDHVGGLLTLRTELSKINPNALSKVHVGKGIFLSRPRQEKERNIMIRIREEYESSGGQIVIYDTPIEFLRGIWFTGPIPRNYSERNWSDNGRTQIGQELTEDNIPEDQAMVINTQKGWVVITGCGHAGIINTMAAARQIIDQPIQLALGGFHLFAATDEHIQWTGEKMKEMELKELVGAHCTGINSVFLLREFLKMNRKSAVVGTVGTTYDIIQGISPGVISR